MSFKIFCKDITIILSTSAYSRIIFDCITNAISMPILFSAQYFLISERFFLIASRIRRFMRFRSTAWWKYFLGADTKMRTPSCDEVAEYLMYVCLMYSIFALRPVRNSLSMSDLCFSMQLLFNVWREKSHSHLSAMGKVSDSDICRQ